jgi:YHS domain-containing protein
MKIVALSFFILLSFQLVAQVEPISKDGVAIGGFDLVAYFLPGKATQGYAEYAFKYKGVNYYFSSVSNKNAFALNPEKYLPQFDGWCALAVGEQKKKVNINPETFKVTDGKLYLFYNSSHKLSGTKFNSLEPWLKNESKLIQKANVNWQEVSTKKK